jgi:cell division protein FtsW (lipid II flippase)
MWAAGVVVLVFQNDFGTALLFFGIFVMMLYTATDQIGWVIAGLVAFAAAAFVVFRYTSHVRVRVDSWLDPFGNTAQNGQIIEGQFGMAWGGLIGRGWGLGSPSRVPLVSTDFISAAIGEELGLVGLMAVIVVYALIAARGMKTALMTRDSFGKLLTSGFSFLIILQVTAIIGGVTRLLPLTGLTTPFLSRGGSSLLANWVIVALLIAVSHQARRPTTTFEPFVDLDVEATAWIDLS